MQPMTWVMSRLGSRFSLMFEPYQRRVMHSALGRFLDQPMDLAVGLIEPDGTHRALPFTADYDLLDNVEQFERLNSITFRGFCPKYGLRFEFNVHSVFYPREEAISTAPVFFLELRVNPQPRFRWAPPTQTLPSNVKVFLRLKRPGTKIEAVAQPKDCRIDLSYNAACPRGEAAATGEHEPCVAVSERIRSLNDGCTATEDGQGLELELPVTSEGSGVKWRLLWGAYCGDPVLDVKLGADGARQGRFRYADRWPNLQAMMDEALAMRDQWLAYSRRFEKLIDQATLDQAERHLMNLGFQTMLGNTWWCNLDDGREWFSSWEGSSQQHSTLDVEYNVVLFYLSLWPRLLAMQLEQWPLVEVRHEDSGGSYLGHDLGKGLRVDGPHFGYEMPVEEATNYLLLLQAYTHWTGHLAVAHGQADLIERLAKYLIWTDRDGTGFPSHGTASTLTDAGPAARLARKQTYMAIKRVAALQAAADLLGHIGRDQPAQQCDELAHHDARQIESRAWIGDHYAVCVDPSAAGLIDPTTDQPLPYEDLPGWDGYSIHTANGLLLPTLVGRPPLLSTDRLGADMVNAARETLGHYGCGHTSADLDAVWISHNIWRDLLARYLNAPFGRVRLCQRYWDLQVMSNTHTQSLSFTDSYIGNDLSFYPRGAASFGYLLAYARLVIDRLAPGGHLVAVQPDRHTPGRWPLLPLADWEAGKIPVCVVDNKGRVVIEGQGDPIIIRGEEASGLIG